MVSAGAWAALAGMGGAQAAPCPCGKTIVYVDCGSKVEGSDGSKEKPYKGLGELAEGKFGPGSEIRLMRGVTCNGSLAFQGSGNADDPIVVGPYGAGPALPKIDAAGAEQALRLDGQQYVTVTDLELTAPGDGTKPRRGVLVTAKDVGTMHGINLTGLDIHDVKGAVPAEGQPAAEAGVSGGIVLEALGDTTPTAFDGLVISGNRIRSVDRIGVSLWSNWCRTPDLAPDWKPACAQAWKPTKNLVIKDNVLTDIGGDGVRIATTDGAKIRGNTLQGFNARVPGSLGVTVQGATATGIENNEVSGGVSANGGLAFGIGGATAGTTVQSNVSHDNDGGFLQLAGSPAAPVRDFAVRGNLSVNDAARGVLVTGGPLMRGQIAGNTVQLDAGVDQLIVDAKADKGLDVKFVDNLISRASGGDPEDRGTVGWNLEGDEFVVDHNLLAGVPVPDGAKATITGDPALLAPGAVDPYGYQVRQGSPSLGAGLALNGLLGFPVSPSKVPSDTPNVGAIQAPAAYPASVSETFNSVAQGKPEGWTAKGDVKVAADPAGFAGNSLVLPGGSAATRTFPAGGGFLRVNARIHTTVPSKAVVLQVADASGKAVASVGVDEGKLTYTDDVDTRMLPYPVPANTWLRVSLLLRPESGTYDLAVGGTTLTTAQLREDAKVATRLIVAADDGAGLAVDDVLVFPEACPGPSLTPEQRLAYLPDHHS